MSKISDYIELARPFTLLPPFMGFVCFALVAVGLGDSRLNYNLVLKILIGAISASVLNAGSNIVNQIFDISIDRVNKPERPLPSGKINIKSAVVLAVFLYILAIFLSYFVNIQYFVIVLITAFITYAYSGYPFRTKRFGILANITMAIPRGGLLVVAGWSAARSVFEPEVWFIALIFFLYILGASTTKDFSDIEGDRKGNCRTLPIVLGVRGAVIAITPAFIIPFILIILFRALGLLTGSDIILYSLGAVLSSWGIYISFLLLRDPEALCLEANHPSWKHMYLLMVVGQIGFALSYLIRF
ncbi:MAG: UbiA prenyltransferase family protein [bacterium]